MLNVDCEFRIREDIEFILKAEGMNAKEFAERTGISRTTLDAICKQGKARADVCEKVYSYVYRKRYRLNSVKEELLKEKYNDVLFHGSKDGLTDICVSGSRGNCDFGSGFYLGESYDQALSFVSEKPHSSVYSFKYSLDGLKVKTFACDLEWMLAVCYHRGYLKEYESNGIVRSIVDGIGESDIVIAPIADNRMFYIMNQFADGDINSSVALHSLSASRLGLQYVFRTEKALDNLSPIEKYYVSVPEREDCLERMVKRSYEVDTKFKLAKREFREGLFIEEILE